MKAIDMMSVYELASNISMSDEAKKAVKAAMREQCSFNRIIKDMKSAAIYPLLANVLEAVGVNSRKKLTVANIKSMIAAVFIKTVTRKVGGEEKKLQVICSIRKRYEYAEAQLCDKDGKPLCKIVDGKPVPRAQKVAKLDDLGEKIVKDYTLCEIKNWTIPGLLNLLAQSKVIRDGVK